MDCCVPTTIREHVDRDVGRSYKCTIWQDDDIIRAAAPPDVFVVLLRYSCSLDDSSSLEEDMDDQFEYFWIKNKTVLDGDISGLGEIIKSFDSDFTIHEVNGMMKDIMNFVRKLEQAPNLNMNNQGECKGMSIFYDIKACDLLNELVTDISELVQEIRREFDDILISSRRSIGAGAAAASKCLIQLLPKGKYYAAAAGGDDDENLGASAAAAACCMVCLGDILNGEEIIWMPCTHFYHQDCITMWLQTRNICPLCRFSLPH